MRVSLVGRSAGDPGILPVQWWRSVRL